MVMAPSELVCLCAQPFCLLSKAILFLATYALLWKSSLDRKTLYAFTYELVQSDTVRPGGRGKFEEANLATQNKVCERLNSEF
jgi:hypothetical protein